MNRDQPQRLQRHHKRSLPRVLLVTQNDGYPDDTRVALECECLNKAGCQVCVICPTGVSNRLYENVHGVHVYRYPRPWDVRGLLGYVWEYSYCLTWSFLLCLYISIRRGFDVLQARTPPDFHVLLGWFFKLFGKKYVVEMLDLCPELYRARSNGEGSRLIRRVLSWFERRNCQAADYVIASSESQRRVMVERGGTPADRCCLVRNTPDPRFLEPIEPIASLREDGRFIVGYMGLIGVQDRVDLLIRALNYLKYTMGRDEFLAVIVGSGPELGEVKRLCSEFGIDRQVMFTGYLTGEDLVRHVASFDVGVVPDPSNEYNDTCSMCKIMNYMAVAIPVVGFDLVENHLTSGDTALYASGNCADDLARQIARLMDSGELCMQLGQAGKKRLLEQFTWEHAKPDLLKAYCSLWPDSRALEHELAKDVGSIGETNQSVHLNFERGGTPA